MDPEEFEAIVRRVVREELHRHYATGGRPHRIVVETPRRGAIASDDEGVQNVRRVLEYTKQIDPHGTMPKEELKHLVRMRFPEYGM
jgi:hypothetical protein